MALGVYNRFIQDEDGNVVANATVTVLLESTGAPALLFSDREGLAGITNPMQSDANGKISVYLRGGAYRVTWVLGSSSGEFRHEPVGTAQELDAEDFTGYANLRYQFDTDTSEGAADAVIRASEVSLADADYLYIAVEDADALDQEAFLTQMGSSTNPNNKGYIFLRALDGNQVVSFRVTGEVVVGYGYGYVIVPVAYVAGSLSFTDNQSLTMQYSRTGDRGEQGLQGIQGIQGAVGLVGSATSVVRVVDFDGLDPDYQYEVGDLVDDIVLEVGDVILRAASDNQEVNGVWVVQEAYEPAARHPNFSDYSQFTGVLFSVVEGYLFGGAIFKSLSTGDGDLGIDPIPIEEFTVVATGAVRYDQLQALSGGEKAQARTNIDVPSNAEAALNAGNLALLADYTAARNNLHAALYGQYYGVSISRASASTITFTSTQGEAASDHATAPRLMKPAGTITKSMAGTWVVGNNNGLDQGAKANSTWYACYMISTAAGVVDYVFSTNFTSPNTMPATYTNKRLIWAIYIDGSGNIENFIQIGNFNLWVNPVETYSAFPIGTTTTAYTMRAPPIAGCLADISALAINASGQTLFSMTHGDLVTASNYPNFGTPGASLYDAWRGNLYVDASCAIKALSANPSGGTPDGWFRTHGWWFPV